MQCSAVEGKGVCVPGIAGGHTLPTTTGQREGLPVKMIANDDDDHHHQHHDHHDDDYDDDEGKAYQQSEDDCK